MQPTPVLLTLKQVGILATFIALWSVATLVAGVLTMFWQRRRARYLGWGASAWWFLSLYFAASGAAFLFVPLKVESPVRDVFTFLTQFGSVAHAFWIVATARVLVNRSWASRSWVWIGLGTAALFGALSLWYPGVTIAQSPQRIFLRNTVPGAALAGSYALVLWMLWDRTRPRGRAWLYLQTALAGNVVLTGIQVGASISAIMRMQQPAWSVTIFPLSLLAQIWFGLGWVALLIETEQRERASAERQLQHAGRMLRAAIEASDDLIGVVDAQERLVLFNSRMASTIESVTGRPASPGMPYPRPGRTDEERAAFFQTIKRALRGERVHVRNEVSTTAGQRVVLDRHIVPIVEGQVVTGAFVVARDVTQEQALRDEAERAMRIEAMARMAGGLAHDFNNILTVVQTNLQLLAESGQHDAETIEMLEETAGALNRANVLTRRLLGVARDRPSAAAAVNVGELVQDFSRFLQHAVGDEIVLSLDLPLRPATVFIDPGKFEQVLLNICLNARDAMPRGGSLHISVREEDVDAARASSLRTAAGRFVRISVADDGYGMDTQTLLRAGDPFFTTKPGTTGSGLGLATCRAILSEARGTMAIESVEGEGTTVTILLPPHVATDAARSDDR